MSGGVLVTGASGLLGRTVALQLAARGELVTVMQRSDSGLDVRQIRGDLNDADARRLALAGVDRVIHCAAKVSINGPQAEFSRINVDGTAALLSAARTSGVHSFVHVSTPSVAHLGRAIHGDQAQPADPEGARGNYARTKAEAELLALAASDSDFSVCAVRPHLIWGPGDEQLIGRSVSRRSTLPHRPRACSHRHHVHRQCCRGSHRRSGYLHRERRAGIRGQQRRTSHSRRTVGAHLSRCRRSTTATKRSCICRVPGRCDR